MDHVVQPNRSPSQTARADRKTAVLRDLIGETTGCRPHRILVVGCGTGREAMLLGAAFGAPAAGIDLGARFDPEAAASADLRVMNAEAMQFEDDRFDLVYSFHALEHFSHPDAALAEMARVLIAGGVYCIGTPNIRRIVGYVGSPAPLRNRVKWNVHDYWMRLTGRFSNEKGAHAGFDAEDLASRCRQVFGEAEDLTARYYERLYQRHAATLRRLAGAGLARYLYPCVYMVGHNRKPAAASTVAAAGA